MFAQQVVKQLRTIVYSRYVPSQILNYYDPLTRAQRRGHHKEWSYHSLSLSLSLSLCAVQVAVQLASIVRAAQEKADRLFWYNHSVSIILIPLGSEL